MYIIYLDPKVGVYVELVHVEVAASDWDDAERRDCERNLNLRQEQMYFH